VSLGGVTLRLASHRLALVVWGVVRGDAVALRLRTGDGAAMGFATIAVRGDRSVTATNAAGEPLRVACHVVPQERVQQAEAAFTFEIAVPYTMAKGQAPWANGAEHGRISVEVGQERHAFYLLSDEGAVKASLRRELAGGLLTWKAIFQELGFIPTGIGAGAEWDRFSDCGGYAHLIEAGAQYLLLLEGKRDWEVRRIPALVP
jgi:hypothetical protein